MHKLSDDSHIMIVKFNTSILNEDKFNDNIHRGNTTKVKGTSAENGRGGLFYGIFFIIIAITLNKMILTGMLTVC